VEAAKLQAELRKVRRQLLLLYEIGNLMRRTIQLDELNFLILSAVTSHEGLGFNRAIMLLLNESGDALTGVMAIGPKTPEEAARIWRHIDEAKLQLEGFLDIYRKSQGQIDIDLNAAVRRYRALLTKEHVFSRVLHEDAPLAVLTPESRAQIKDAFLDEIHCETFAAVPLKGKDHVIGILLVDNVSTKKPITREEIRDLCMLGDHAGLAIENAMAYSRAVDRSRRDPLTGLWNHARFQELLLWALQPAQLQKTPVSVLFFDVDDFKKYNDQLGHQQGDRALRFVAETAFRALRKSDVLARYGGEEFGVILPGAGREEALEIAEKLRSQVETKSAGVLNMQTLKTITVSIGVATFPDHALEREKLIYCADAALYEAKNAGKNRVRCYQPASSKI
jgi:diguanylate cyclase (GGDEF)-like protein